MALRDRITIKTKDGTVTTIQATRQGGSVRMEQKTRDNSLLVEEMGQNVRGAPIRSLVVPISELVYVLEEHDVPANKPKRTRKRAETGPEA